jgi:hypothetical protein
MLCRCFAVLITGVLAFNVGLAHADETAKPAVPSILGGLPVADYGEIPAHEMAGIAGTASVTVFGNAGGKGDYSIAATSSHTGALADSYASITVGIGAGVASAVGTSPSSSANSGLAFGDDGARIQSSGITLDLFKGSASTSYHAGYHIKYRIR